MVHVKSYIEKWEAKMTSKMKEHFICRCYPACFFTILCSTGWPDNVSVWSTRKEQLSPSRQWGFRTGHSMSLWSHFHASLSSYHIGQAHLTHCLLWSPQVSSSTSCWWDTHPSGMKISIDCISRSRPGLMMYVICTHLAWDEGWLVGYYQEQRLLLLFV